MNWQDSNVAHEPNESDPRVYLAEPVLATSTPAVLAVAPENRANRLTTSETSGGGWLRACVHLCQAVWRFVTTVTHWCFGFVSLIIILSVLATIPIAQFLSLGYLLEAGGRVAKSGKLRQGFIGISQAARVGSVALGVFLTMLPIRILSSYWYSSSLLNGDVAQTRSLRAIVLVLGTLAVFHILWAVFRGGKLRHFAWPAPFLFWRRVREGGMYDVASHRLLEFVQALRLHHYFWLGLRGFIGATIWLFLPITMLAAATTFDDPEAGGFFAFLGGIVLAIVLVYLPFLQLRLSLTDEFRSQFQVSVVRKSFQRAPLAYWFSLLMTLALAVPLYILKAELIPREAAWLPSLFFVTMMFPARLAVGWAMSRSERREDPRHWFFRWTGWAAMLPVVLTYALIVYFTQFTSWHGAASLYEQHAFLVPVPFLGY